MAPRSTSSHCGSEAALDQRVAVLPSTASAAGVPPFSVDEAVAVLPCESRVSAAWAECMGTNSSTDAMSAVMTAATMLRWARGTAGLGAVEPVGGASMGDSPDSQVGADEGDRPVIGRPDGDAESVTRKAWCRNVVRKRCEVRWSALRLD